MSSRDPEGSAPSTLAPFGLQSSVPKARFRFHDLFACATVIQPSTVTVKAEMVTWGVCEVLTRSNIRFGCNDGFVAERELDLLQGGATPVGQFSKGPTQIMR